MILCELAQFQCRLSHLTTTVFLSGAMDWMMGQPNDSQVKPMITGGWFLNRMPANW